MSALDVPAFPAPLAARWGITAARLIADTPSSHVYRVERSGETSAIAKLLKPKGAHERPGMDFLDFRQGLGAVHLLDRVGDASLIEDAGRLSLREHRLVAGDERSNTIVADLLPRLHAHSPVPAPAGLVPLARHFQPLLDCRLGNAAAPLAANLRMAAGIAAEMLAEQTAVRPLHGDLHHDNILLSPRGWLAIDPQGLVGDPAYDVANIFGNPDGAFDEIVNPDRIAGLARLFAGVLGCPADKILRFAIAHAGLSICWSLADGTPFNESANAGERHAFLAVAGRLLAGRTING